MCLFPRIQRNKKYESTKKNGGIIPAIIDSRTLYVPIKCGECMECRRAKKVEWTVRMYEEIRSRRDGKFILLTFSNEKIAELVKYVDKKRKKKGKLDKKGEKVAKGYALDNEIATVAMHLFLNRWRKKYGKSLRHWFVTELGHRGTENIHLHGIVWTDKSFDEIEKVWQYGWIGRGKKKNNGTYENYVSNRSINYIVKYVTKIDQDHIYYKSRILCSPGIGGTFTERAEAEWNRYNEEETREYYKTDRGFKMSLPIYYRNKLYTEEQREKLWIYKLNKNKRYINGVEVEADSKAYWDILKEAQQKNRKLGFGEGKVNWERYDYEQSRRVFMMNKRIGEK